MAMMETDPLRGTARGSAADALHFVGGREVSRRNEVEAYLREIFRLAPEVGLDPVVLVAQSALETGYWTENEWQDGLNPAAIGVGDVHDFSIPYATGADAARAQIVHAFVYASGPIGGGHALAPFRALDPRYQAVLDAGWAGSVHTIRNLTGKWATDPNYHTKIVARGNAIFPGLSAAGANGGAIHMASPVIQNIQNPADAAMYGISPSEASALLTHCFVNRSGADPRAIVLHIQEGRTFGSLDWWVNGPNVQASATVMIQFDGSILRVIPEEHGPWTNGDVNNPTPQSAPLRALGGNPNIWTLSIEAEGWWNGDHPQAQIDSIVWQVRTWQERYGIPTSMVLPHSSINSVDRSFCPGNYLPRVMAALGA